LFVFKKNSPQDVDETRERSDAITGEVLQPTPLDSQRGADSFVK
jgi:hypothetical protein